MPEPDNGQPKPVQIDKAAVDPQVLIRRAAAKKAAKELSENRESALDGVRPFASSIHILDLPLRQRKSIDEAFSHEVQFNLSDPEPAVHAGAHGVPDQIAVDLAGSTVGDMALMGIESSVPLFDEVLNGDGSVTQKLLTSDERYRRLVSTTFARAFQQENQSLADLLPERVKVAWRIVREMARLKGLAHHDEPMVIALLGTSANPDPWQVPEIYQEPTARDARRDLYPEVIDTFRASEMLDDDFKVHLWVSNDLYNPAEGAQRRKYEGFALIPPPVPPVWRSEEGEISRDYVPRDDPNLNLFLSACSDIAERLQIPSGTKVYPDLGRMGLQGLLDPSTIRICWPTRTQILTWGNMLIEETLDLLVSSSVSQAKKVLKERYGLQQREVLGLLRMASVLAQEQTSSDREDARAIMVLRLEEYVRRAKDALDLRSEMHGLKQLSIVMGLGDAQHNDPMVEFLNAVRQVGQERQLLPEIPAQRKMVENTSTGVTV